MGEETGALPFLISLVKRPQYCYLDSNGHPQTTWRAFHEPGAATDPTARERSGWRLPARSCPPASGRHGSDTPDDTAVTETATLTRKQRPDRLHEPGVSTAVPSSAALRPCG